MAEKSVEITLTLKVGVASTEDAVKVFAAATEATMAMHLVNLLSQRAQVETIQNRGLRAVIEAK